MKCKICKKEIKKGKEGYWHGDRLCHSCYPVKPTPPSTRHTVTSPYWERRHKW